jgi:hypothetical protein
MGFLRVARANTAVGVSPETLLLYYYYSSTEFTEQIHQSYTICTKVSRCRSNRAHRENDGSKGKRKRV